MSFLLTKIKDLYINARGFHTHRKLVVFESDDWGSVRMPSKAVFERLKSLGDAPEKDAFLSNDCLENESDLLALYDVLGSVADCKGNPAVFTLNFAMANPNFEKTDYKKGVYEYEPFYETYDKYYGENNVLDLVKQGYKKRLVLPQLHCREHLNVGRWMHDLSVSKPDALLAFDCKTMGVGASFHDQNRFAYMDAFNTDYSSNEQLWKILSDAVRMFETVFGFNSATFAASCYVWNEQLEECLMHHGVSYIQSAPWQNKPTGTNGTYRLKRALHYTGQKNKRNQMYSVRNCNFEPAYNQDPQACVRSCLDEISKAFKAGKPAVVSTHRFNYIASINASNRTNNLMGLKSLLDGLVERYGDVEFISSAELFAIMAQEKR